MHYTRQPWAGKESSGILPLCLCMYACMYENTVCRRHFMAVFWRAWKDIIYPLWSYPSKSFSSMPWIEKEIHGLNCARRACFVCMYISMRSSVAFFTRLKACEGGIIFRPCSNDNGSSMESRASKQSPQSDRIPPCYSLRCHWPTKKGSFIHTYTLLGETHSATELYVTLGAKIFVRRWRWMTSPMVVQQRQLSV